MAKKNKIFWEDDVGLENEDDNVVPKLRVHKQEFALITGRFAEKTIKVALDYQICTKGECTSYAKCPYKCKLKTEPSKCQMEVQLINRIYTEWINGVGDIMTQAQMDVFGLGIIPLYTHLVRFQKESSSTSNVVYSDNKGIKRVEPIFKEIRETIKLIHSELKSSGLSILWTQKFGRRALPVGITEEVSKHGDVGRYDEFDREKS